MQAETTTCFVVRWALLEYSSFGHFPDLSKSIALSRASSCIDFEITAWDVSALGTLLKGYLTRVLVSLRLSF